MLGVVGAATSHLANHHLRRLRLFDPAAQRTGWKLDQGPLHGDESEIAEEELETSDFPSS